MILEKINGNTYYVPAPTNIGVFQFKDKYALLIDTGDNNQQARKIDEVLQSQGLSVKYLISTHNHADHAGGNHYFKEHYPGSIFHASEKEKLFLENPYLFGMYLYGGSSINELSRHFLKERQFAVNSVLTPGMCRINEEKFEVIALPGHSVGQIGIGTRDRVVFLGDALFSKEIIGKYSFPFLFNIDEQMITYDVIAGLEYDYYVLGHADKVYRHEEILDLLELNRQNLVYYLDLARELLTQPKTREELLEEICILKDLAIDFKEYYFSLATTGAIIAHLYHQGQLNYQIENGKLFYYIIG